MAQAASGLPNRFITLTASRAAGATDEERRKALSHAWRVIVLRLRRANPTRAIEYFVVTEATKRGAPHLHILFSGPWITQATLSAWMRQLANSPICDIRRIKHQREVVRYVAKYITKKPVQFGDTKRYWQSRGYQLPDPEREAMDNAPNGVWLMDGRTLGRISFDCENTGFRIEYEDENRLEAIAPNYEGKCQRE